MEASSLDFGASRLYFKVSTFDFQASSLEEFRHLLGPEMLNSNIAPKFAKPIALISRLPQHHWTPHFQPLKKDCHHLLDAAVTVLQSQSTRPHGEGMLDLLGRPVRPVDVV